MMASCSAACHSRSFSARTDAGSTPGTSSTDASRRTKWATGRIAAR